MIFLVSIALIYGALGTVNIADISRRMGEIPVDVQILLHTMLLIAFGIKAAVFPLSFWLPDSYPTAPAPVTAVFAGLLTKVGVYSIIRAETVMFPGPELNTVLMVVALFTMVVGVLGAVAQADIKRLLSFTLVSHIGYMILGVSLGTAAGTSAATFYIVHHIIVQTTLFLAAGLIERIGGTTSINRLGGLLKASPVLAVLFLIPALNLGGIPPFSGFLGKLALFQATAEQQSPLGYVLIGAGALVSLLTLYALIRVWSLAFWRTTDEIDGYESELLRNVSEAPNATATQATRRIPRLMLAATGGMVGVGILLTVFAGPLFMLSDEVGDALETPNSYVDIVFPGGDDD